VDYEEYSDWERRALIAFRREGFSTALATGLRDAGVRLAMMVDAAPLAEEVIDTELKKVPLTPVQKAALKRYWREIEGGGA
jgi:hypothetical protein